MVSAVAGAAALRSYGAPAPVDSQAMLARLQHQLSDNVNCASARTPEGKATIAAIEDKIAVLKERMEGKPAAATASGSAENADVTMPARAARAIGSTSGGLIDVYA